MGIATVPQIKRARTGAAGAVLPAKWHGFHRLGETIRTEPISMACE
jgi:hypothetical protein